MIALSQLLRISEDRFDPHILFTTLRMKHPLERTAYRPYMMNDKPRKAAMVPTRNTPRITIGDEGRTDPSPITDKAPTTTERTIKNAPVCHSSMKFTPV